MTLIRFGCTAVLVLGVAQAAAAQSATPVGTSGRKTAAPAVMAAIDVSRLPIDLQRIERQFRQGQTREERNGLNLRYYVDVFAPAPKLVLLTKADNLQFGQVPQSAPTHRDMVDMMTPQGFRHHGLINIIGPNPKK